MKLNKPGDLNASSMFGKLLDVRKMPGIDLKHPCEKVLENFVTLLRRGVRVHGGSDSCRDRAGAYCSGITRSGTVGPYGDSGQGCGAPFSFRGVRALRAPTIATAATREEPLAPMATTTKEGPKVLSNTTVGPSSIRGEWPLWRLMINSPGIPVKDILDEIATWESDSGVGGGGDTEEMITDEMEVDAVEAMEMLGRTQEVTGKAPMVMEDAGTSVPIFDRLVEDLGAESTRRVTFLDYEEFVEDKDVFKAELKESGIAAMVFEARAGEAEPEELLRRSELIEEGNEVLRELSRRSREQRLCRGCWRCKRFRTSVVE
ncbi:hypothetical protein RHMOL_Rhmol02G0174200 [Rhododendron molle]|uniref:Uncharacterized protein n=1 Tax=Rhododendron molle TaxID=49168 RepID=A0ACC0PTM7_RHOML|nr:hypothetical protein RHMOL_Rhmol02G0174200 [Rhododendron molle]